MPNSPLPLKPIPPEVWDALLAYCVAKDVEEGDSADYMYSVRLKTGALTIWTQPGWKAGWWVARVHPVNRNKKVNLELEVGTAPGRDAWTTDRLVEHLLLMFHRVAPHYQVKKKT